MAPHPAATHSLPLFPLKAVLMPGGVMALRVFEPRYLRLVRRALAQPSRQFGMVAPSADPLESRSAPCASHGSVVVIDMVSELDPNP